MTFSTVRVLAVAALMCAAVVPVLAGNETPPPWQSTGLTGNETHWRWDFFPNSPLTPVGQGIGTPNITGGTWLPNAPDPTGGGTLGDGIYAIGPGQTVTIGMPNFPIVNDFKYIWIEYHYFGGPEPVTGASVGNINASPYGPTVTPSPGAGGGLVGAQGWQFPFNPEFEFITITNPSTANNVIYLEWLSIYTICAPAPGAAAVFACGLAVLGRRRVR